MLIATDCITVGHCPLNFPFPLQRTNLVHANNPRSVSKRRAKPFQNELLLVLFYDY